MNHVLEIDSIQLQFNERKILSNIYLRCETGQITGLLGKNGQGKSCLMKAIYGSLHCEKSIRFDRISIVESFKRPDLIVYLPQSNFIPKSLSLSRVFQDFDLEYSAFQNRFLEFAKRQNDSVSSLSGGERRLLELYIIAKSKSLFALLDEPFTQLNPLQIEKAKQFLKEERGCKGMLITDHMYRHVIDICDTLYVLTNGQTYLAKSIADIEALGYARLQ